MPLTLQSPILGAGQPPVVSSDEIIDHVDSALQPALHSAISGMHPLGQEALRQAFSPAPDTQPAPTTAAIKAAPVGGLPKVTPPVNAGPPPISAAQNTHQAEYNRLTGAGSNPNQGKSGIGQIHSAWGRVPLQILDALGTAVAPGLTMMLPGTQLHHQLLAKQAEGQLNQDEGQREKESKIGLEGAEAQHALAEAQATKADTPHTLQTDQGIMQWNPETSRFDIPAGQPPVKEEDQGKTITTDQGIMQWDPKTKTYSIKAGNTPEKESTADKTLQDADGVWYHIGKDNMATPITVGGKPFQGKTPSASDSAEEQFVHEYQAKNKGATVAQAQRAYKLNEQLPPQRDPDVALDRETTHYAKAHEKSVADAASQLEKISEAESMIGSNNAEAQALGIPKVLTALVSGAGSGVRITQPELNAIAKARGIKGDFQAFVQKLSSGKSLTPDQQKELLSVLADAKVKIAQKQGIANDALDKINGARSRDEIIKADAAARKAMTDLEKSGAASGQPSGHMIQVNGKTYQYKGSGPTDNMDSYTEVKK